MQSVLLETRVGGPLSGVEWANNAQKSAGWLSCIFGRHRGGFSLPYVGGKIRGLLQAVPDTRGTSISNAVRYMAHKFLRLLHNMTHRYIKPYT